MPDDELDRWWQERHEQPAEPHPAWNGDQWPWWGLGVMTAAEKEARDAEEGWIEP